MIEAGRALILFSLLASVGAAAAGIRSWLLGGSGGRWGEVAARAVHSAFAASTAAVVILLIMLGGKHFEVAYVWSYTSSTLPLPYALSALWAGQAGSLLFWAFVLLGFGVLVLSTQRERHPELLPIAMAVIGVTGAFFLTMTVIESPFQTIWEKYPDAPRGMIPPDGNGLNPMLQNPGMVIHPPLLYLGYVGFTIPFAFAIAALVTGQLGPDWMRTTRRWSLVSWLFLSLGILAGAKWAYVELGWGGYWAWDPVENASFIPWLTGTAFIHSVMIEERRGMFRAWNVTLVTLTFLLCVFGTFLTRSGLISSVHAFAQSGIGSYFGGFLAAAGILSGGLIWHRRKELRAEHRIESLLSREAAFLFNNVVLLAMAFTVLWGTMYPIISEYATGEKASVGPPYFNRVMLPMSLILILLTAFGPILAWRRANPEALKRYLLVPAAFALLLGAGLFAWGVRPIEAVGGFVAAFLVVGVSCHDLTLASLQRRAKKGESLPVAAWALLRRNGRRYGGYLVHVGMALLFAGILGSYFNLVENATLRPGETMRLGAYSFNLRSVEEIQEAHRDGMRAHLSLARDGRSLGMLRPEISLFRGGNEGPQQASEVDIRSHLAGDLYVALLGVNEDGSATIQARWNALVGWVWFGSGLVVVGVFFALLPPARKQESPVGAMETARLVPDAGVTLPLLLFGLFAATAPPAAATPLAAAPGAAAPRSVVDAVQAEVICPCGCGMTVGTCTHIGCGGCAAVKPRVAKLAGEGKTPSEILTALETEFGKSILAAPPKRGFDWSAWGIPFASLAAAAAAGGLWLRRWRRTREASPEAEPAPEDPAAAAAVARALESFR